MLVTAADSVLAVFNVAVLIMKTCRTREAGRPPPGSSCWNPFGSSPHPQVLHNVRILAILALTESVLLDLACLRMMFINLVALIGRSAMSFPS